MPVGVWNGRELRGQVDAEHCDDEIVGRSCGNARCNELRAGNSGRVGGWIRRDGVDRIRPMPMPTEMNRRAVLLGLFSATAILGEDDIGAQEASTALDPSL
jgi:hypothetical protein